MAAMAGYLHSLLIVLCFLSVATCLHAQQWLGLPLYWINRSWADGWQAYVKASTTIMMIGLNQWRAPVTAHISSDASVKGQIKKGNDGKIICDFPTRMIITANHQIYTDWLSLWWTAYTANFHDHFYVVLKDDIRRIPVIGQGLVFFSWVFLSRRWEMDRQRLEESIRTLSDPTNRTSMWLVIFPEGTNLTKRSLAISTKWANQRRIKPSELTLLPRARGLQACLAGLADSVNWVYDCTIAYEDLPSGIDSQDMYNLKTLYIDGRKAPATHVHWRRFEVTNIPWQDLAAFEEWLIERWAEKEELLKYFGKHGCFPSADGYITTDIRLHSSVELLRLASTLLAPVAAWWILRRLYSATVSLYGYILPV